MDHINSSTQKYELPWWIWILPAPLFVGFQIAVRGYSPELARALLAGEGGWYENLTVIILFPAIYFAVRLVLDHKKLPARWLSCWYALLGLACVYFAGEEASWGQHWFGWETPEWFGERNDQGETNFHNMSSWFDQKPRLIVELSAIFAGVIFPIYRRRKKIIYKVNQWQSYFWPAWVCLPVSLVVGIIKLPDRIIGTHNIPYPFNIGVSETQELYVAIGFLIYLASVWVRHKRGMDNR
ncbi:hypothetical protein GUA87_05980 [Sneathiella sp. P13V-1]|uniref:hypothetical protein n=1 Tax=Sneathiella sp. P13V-1 TaxID=2697366 RepID=UPI00187B21CD|nr:hypothetical protein [Sneathiella sp. P13V-1]MBE7636386.1 hypothetical protein [Sneathiella sp. P13V-1]